jgi:hypothetical protein
MSSYRLVEFPGIFGEEVAVGGLEVELPNPVVSNAFSSHDYRKILTHLSCRRE